MSEVTEFFDGSAPFIFFYLKIGCYSVPLSNSDEPLYKKVIKTAFNQKRKTIKNALKCFNFNEENKINHLFHLRAENLSVEDFITITNNVK